MGNLQLKFATWLFTRLGYKIAAVKETPHGIVLTGERQLFEYLDVAGYLSKREPLQDLIRIFRETTEKAASEDSIKPLPPEVVDEIIRTTVPFPTHLQLENERLTKSPKTNY